LAQVQRGLQEQEATRGQEIRALNSQAAGADYERRTAEHRLEQLPAKVLSAAWWGLCGGLLFVGLGWLGIGVARWGRPRLSAFAFAGACAVALVCLLTWQMTDTLPLQQRVAMSNAPADRLDAAQMEHWGARGAPKALDRLEERLDRKPMAPMGAA